MWRVAFGNFVVDGIVDGKTRAILSLVLMNTKKAIEMFRQVYLPALVEYGLADQFVSDAGTEFKPVECSQTHAGILNTRNAGCSLSRNCSTMCFV